MNSEELYRELILLYDGYNEVTSNNPINKVGLLKTIAENIDNTVEELFEKGKEENYYWENCTFLTYQNKYQERLEEYLHHNDNEDYNEFDFIKSERSAIEHSAQRHYLTFVSPDIVNSISKSRLRKLSLLQKKEDNLLADYDAHLDLSDSSAALKVIYLQRLGIIDFLHKQYPFNTSINRLAEVLSGITGEKKATLQSYINPIISKSASQKKSPLQNNDNVDMIDMLLKKIGFEKDSF